MLRAGGRYWLQSDADCTYNLRGRDAKPEARGIGPRMGISGDEGERERQLEEKWDGGSRYSPRRYPQCDSARGEEPEQARF
jgi:hypothetical protein